MPLYHQLYYVCVLHFNFYLEVGDGQDRVSLCIRALAVLELTYFVDQSGFELTEILHFCFLTVRIKGVP